MTQGICMYEHGGPGVLRWERVSLLAPAAGEITVRHTAVGLNYIDIYHRSGLYPLLLPSGLGLEAAGVVTAIGDDLQGFSVGDRVCYGTGPIGAYAEARTMPVASLLKIPDDVTNVQAAAMMLKGMTAYYLLRQTFRVEPGMVALVRAAAGGVGLFLCQWLRHLGVIVIGTVSSDEKADLARVHGCHYPIVSGRKDCRTIVKDLTDGMGVHVVYDGIGQDTFAASLDCLRPRGMMVSYGNVSSPVLPVDPLELSHKGSLFLTRPALAHYTATRTALEEISGALFAAVSSGVLLPVINQIYPLAAVAEAHWALESRQTSGSTVLVP